MLRGRYNQLADEGLEDDDRLVEEVSAAMSVQCCSNSSTVLLRPAVFQAAVHDRAWDDWKAENPRGSGNKMGKRF